MTFTLRISCPLNIYLDLNRNDTPVHFDPTTRSVDVLIRKLVLLGVNNDAGIAGRIRRMSPQLLEPVHARLGSHVGLIVIKTSHEMVSRLPTALVSPQRLQRQILTLVRMRHLRVVTFTARSARRGAVGPLVGRVQVVPHHFRFGIGVEHLLVLLVVVVIVRILVEGGDEDVVVVVGDAAVGVAVVVVGRCRRWRGDDGGLLY